MTLDEAIQFAQEHTENDLTRQLYQTVTQMNVVRKKGRAASPDKKHVFERRLENHLNFLHEWGRDAKLVTICGEEVYILLPTDEEIDIAHRYIKIKNAKEIAIDLKRKEATLKSMLHHFADSMNHYQEISDHFPIDDLHLEGITASALEIELLHRECVTQRYQLRTFLGLDPGSPVKKF